MNEINIIELFAGIGGFSKGFEDAGFKINKHYYSEIDKHAIANYKHNFPNAEYIGSVTNIPNGSFTGIDVITFGSPCQDFSLAGNREGLEGQRSSLIWQAIRLISDIRPGLFIWENVKGAFSSNGGADFWAIIAAFANIGGYRLEWQLLNTKWFLPQNRERIYLVGHLAAAGRSFGNVFPIGEDDGLFDEAENSNQRRTQTKFSSTTLRAGNMKATDTFIEIPKVAGTLTGGGNSGGLHSDMTTIKIGAMRGRNPENPLSRKSELATEQMLELNENGTSNALTSVQKDNLVVVHNTMPRSSKTGKGGTGPLSKFDEAYCLDTGNTNAIEIGTWRTHKDGEGFRKVSDDNCPTIPARARQDGSGQPVITIHYGHPDKEPKISEISPTLKAESHGHEPMTNIGSNIRRLTEIECERLQGFPDNWTMYGNYNGTIKQIPKTQRYKMLGNAVTVKVVEEIAKRLKI